MATLINNAPKIPVGMIKTFGPFGPKYEVREATRYLENGDWMLRIIMVETGETAEYRYSKMVDDPEAK